MMAPVGGLSAVPDVVSEQEQAATLRLELEQAQVELRRTKRMLSYRDSQMKKMRAEREASQPPSQVGELEKLVKKLEELAAKMLPANNDVAQLKQQLTAWEEKWRSAWYEMGQAANSRGLCSEYDEIVRRIGGIDRPALGIRRRGY